MIARDRQPRRWLAALLAALLPLGAADAGDGRRVAHAFGDTTIPAPPQRVVTLYQGATDSAVALGITPVGVVDSWLEKPMYRYLRDALKGIEHVGLETQPNLEKVAWLDPDLIVATRFRHERVKPLLEQVAPTVATGTVFDFKASLALLAEATGREARAHALMQDWDARVADFRRQIADQLGDAWPQKAAVVRFKSDHVRLYSTGFAGSILDELGFEQPDAVQDQGWGMKLTSEENIPVLNADVIFVLLEPDDPAIARNYRHWRSHPLWQRLDAVESERVFEVDAVNWIMGGGILAANAMLDDLYAHYGLDNPDERSTPALTAAAAADCGRDTTAQDEESAPC
ncbi:MULTISPECIES: iron-siderophore ABC transporter substrate-binding protein [unclassified Halomonas]|uniref:ABC transporter substrate-binding protein n=1 Tax=unclassified Halomonas TaxID=2609666 RepID=UPI002886D1F4|nr:MULTISPECIES: iron-siderophore ABC transporter substrate-binding protein [unclassified Halomonas]MDT0501168.1 iron-siderophore ABC transporter substrate-binding protein [Halomonas sp. PAR7]MDT0511453.1 iron-siderophore ABC transporter substrate-binding protein [Halomonas sp. LES1]MDT0590259.1 iron-siderophore ABC transporter substrate-binding protein [Halomonas sp. PAR8]